MADYADSDGCLEPEDESPAPAQLNEGGDSAGDSVDEVSLDSAEEEAESLKRRLAMYERELDALQQQAAAVQSESLALAESMRREAEVKARQIIRRATVEAELLELRGRARAEEMRATGVAGLWARSYRALESPEARGDTGMLDHAAEVELTSPAKAEECRLDGQTASPGPDACLTVAEPIEGESVPDAATPARVEVRQYPVSRPMTPTSVAAIEEAVGRIGGVLAAKVGQSPDGGAVLAVSSDDPRSTELAIRRLNII